MGRFLYSKDCLALTAQHTQHSLIRQGGRQAGGHKLGSGISRGEGDVVIIHKMGVSPGRRHPETLPDTHLPAEGKACAHLPAEGKACAHLPVPRQYGDMGVMQPGGILSEPGHNRPSCPSTNLSQATTDPPAPLPTSARPQPTLLPPYQPALPFLAASAGWLATSGRPTCLRPPCSPRGRARARGLGPSAYPAGTPATTWPPPRAPPLHAHRARPCSGTAGAACSGGACCWVSVGGAWARG